jgi:hypothetical protein
MNKKYEINYTFPNCLSEYSGTISITDLTNGNLSMTWLNLPETAVINSKGMSVNNLQCGIYELDIYDTSTDQNHKEIIDITCFNDLTLDLVQIDDLNCINDMGVLNISWSGGQAPYKVSLNSDSVSTNDTHLSYDIIANKKYKLTIKDSNNCILSKSDIIKTIKPMKVEIGWESIKHNGGVSGDVFYKIQGGVEPYKVAWFTQKDTNHPLIINQNHIQNKLQSNHYKLMVTDSVGCSIDKSFYISEPPPIIVQTKESADYSFKATYPNIKSKSFYNLILLNNYDKPIKYLLNKKITLKHKNINSKQKIIMNYGNITLDGVDYQYFYINPGIPALKSSNSELIIEDGDDSEALLLSHDINFNNQNKLLVGSVILSDIYDYIFHDNDIVEIIDNDGNTLKTCIDQAHNQAQLYDNINASTVINFINRDNSESEDILKLLNNRKSLNNNQIKCLTTKYNNKMGELHCLIHGGDKQTLKLDILYSDGNVDTYDIDNNSIILKNLTHGTYRIKVYDKYNIAHEYNRIYTGEYYEFDIMSSFDEEQENCKIAAISKYNLDPSFLNRYDQTPSKLLFTSPEFKNGVLINISPSESCYDIIDDEGNVIEDCGYKVINLEYGKYKIYAQHEGHESVEKVFFVNSPKELVTIVLEKE